MMASLPAPRPRQRRLRGSLPVAAPALIFAILWGAPALFGGEADARPGDRPSRAARAALPVALPGDDLDAYSKALASFLRKEEEVDGLTVTVEVIPDSYLHQMATSYEELKRSGNDELQIEAKLRSLHASNKKNAGKPIFVVTLSGDGYRMHYWLQKKPKAHVELKIGKKVSHKAVERAPRASFANWKIYELNNHKRFTKKLAYLKQCKFEVTPTTAPKKAKKKMPMVLTVKNILRYQEVDKRNPYERIGINVGVKQLALAEFRELFLQPISFTFYPAKWKIPAPPEKLRRILSRLKDKDRS
ncbi:MAG: hypothetical protein ACE5GW_04125 [Planctomycetota bacterium]